MGCSFKVSQLQSGRIFTPMDMTSTSELGARTRRHRDSGEPVCVTVSAARIAQLLACCSRSSFILVYEAMSVIWHIFRRCRYHTHNITDVGPLGARSSSLRTAAHMWRSGSHVNVSKRVYDSSHQKPVYHKSSSQGTRFPFYLSIYVSVLAVMHSARIDLE